MKKWMIILMAAAVSLMLNACNTNNNDSQQSSAPESILEPEELQEPETPAPDVTVADAAIYRGLVTVEEGADGETLYRLVAVEGTDFGAPSLLFAVTDTTRLLDEDQREINNGDHVEIAYGAPLGGDLPEQVDAITVRILPDAALTVHRGTVTAVNRESDTNGTIMLDTDDGDLLLIYSETSGLYLDMEALAEGDVVTAYTTPASAETTPRQAEILELRKPAQD